MNYFNYSIFYDIVKILKLLWIVVDNIINFVISETLRNEIVESLYITKESIKFISDHKHKHLKPLNDEQFGHYLAGLIDGDGHFSSKQQLVIVFHSSDVSLAYFIKKRLGYGNVKKVKTFPEGNPKSLDFKKKTVRGKASFPLGKNAFLLIVSSKDGIIKILNLINGKIRTENKFYQISYNILNNPKYLVFGKNFCLNRNLSKDLKNHWLAGFSDADASFKIKTIDRENRTEIRLNFKIDQKGNDLLLLIKQFFGGNIGFRKTQDTYYYGSTSFGSAKNIINYFDHFHLLSSKYVNFLKWRKAYQLIQKKDHLNKKGIEKIIQLKNSMNRSDDTTI